MAKELLFQEDFKPLAYTDILWEKGGKDNRVCTITLNRPHALNALRNRLQAEFIHGIKSAEADPEVRVIRIKGAGRAFSAGYDLAKGNEGSTMPDVGPGYAGPNQAARLRHTLWGHIWECNCPVIAQTHGYCLAGASELCSMCDLLVTTPDCQFGYPPIRGMSAPDLQWFPWLLPMRIAKMVALTGGPLTGEEAYKYGMATYCVPADQIDEFTMKLCERVGNIEKEKLGMNKRSINMAYEVKGIKLAESVGDIFHGYMGTTPGAHLFGDAREKGGLQYALSVMNGPYGDFATAPKRVAEREQRVKARPKEEAEWRRGHEKEHDLRTGPPP